MWFFGDSIVGLRVLDLPRPDPTKELPRRSPERL